MTYMCVYERREVFESVCQLSENSKDRAMTWPPTRKHNVVVSVQFRSSPPSTRSIY